MTEQPESVPPKRPAQSLDAIRGTKRTFYRQFRMLAGHTHDERGKGDRLSPNVLADGEIQFDDTDGQVLGPIPVRLARWEIATFNPEQLSVRRETEWRIRGFNLLVTDARLVLVAHKPEKDSRRFAGHLRYPWITSIGFRPKQSFLNDCELVVGTQQEIAADVHYFNELTLTLHNEADSGELAQALVRRLARHHLDRGTLPDAVVAEFEVLREAERLPDPEKGSHAWYYPPAFKSYPYGVGYSDQQDENTWRGPRLGTP
ncbi:hypothetical protein [Promicromonospora sp. NFX87]|uniref:hypothetical protein n=1 Tax=Promicromonospora sp. NFX87 TaxID=3402691 RepID=UPI003AFA2E1B